MTRPNDRKMKHKLILGFSALGWWRSGQWVTRSQAIACPSNCIPQSTRPSDEIGFVLISHMKPHQFLQSCKPSFSRFCSRMILYNMFLAAFFCNRTNKSSRMITCVYVLGGCTRVRTTTRNRVFRKYGVPTPNMLLAILFGRKHSMWGLWGTQSHIVL